MKKRYRQQKNSGRPAVELVMKLMAIPGPSGREGQVAEFITNELRNAGADDAWIRVDTAHRRTQLRGETGNVILRLPGSYSQPARLHMAHMDTVPICVGSKPARAKNTVRSANQKTGLGADDRAGCAVLLHTALKILYEDLPHPPLVFVWTVQEEVGLEGARHLRPAHLHRPARAFNWDGGSVNKLTIGATGGYRMAIRVHGKASHAGGAPEDGISAIAVAALAISDLQKNGWHGAIKKNRRLGTSNVGYIHGGEATNVVTDFVSLKAEARSHDSEFRQEIVAAIEKAFRRAASMVTDRDGKTGEAEFDGRLDYESFCLDPRDPSVVAAAKAVAECKMQPELAVSNGGLDANWLFQHGVPAVTLGCGQRNIHTVKEELDLEIFLQACDVALWLSTQQELPE